jgi:hypothetical protein
LGNVARYLVDQFLLGVKGALLSQARQERDVELLAVE